MTCVGSDLHLIVGSQNPHKVLGNYQIVLACERKFMLMLARKSKSWPLGMNGDNFTDKPANLGF